MGALWLRSPDKKARISNADFQGYQIFPPKSKYTSLKQMCITHTHTLGEGNCLPRHLIVSFHSDLLVIHITLEKLQVYKKKVMVIPVDLAKYFEIYIKKKKKAAKFL